MSYFLWNELDQDWDTTEEYWIIEKIIGGGHVGDAAQWFGNYQKLNKEEKRKVIRLIMTRNGIKFQQSKEIREDDYTVTVNDIKELVEDYLEEKKKIQIKVTDVTLDTDDSEWGV
jgi:hypothetical protein